jgi:hypothetical protein
LPRESLGGYGISKAGQIGTWIIQGTLDYYGRNSINAIDPAGSDPIEAGQGNPGIGFGRPDRDRRDDT